MALEPQKAPLHNENAASEERQQETTAQSTGAHSEVEETAKKKTKSQKTAQQRHDAQPEVEKLPQGLTQTEAPEAPEAEDDDVRRKSDEFTLRWSLEAQQHVKNKPADFVRMVIAAAYARIYLAEALLCGILLIVPIGRVGPVDKFEKWWTAFKVGDLWFILRYHDTRIREYEIVPAFGPTPGDGGDPPPMTRQQRGPPPQRIGTRTRAPRRGNPQGSRAVRKPPTKKGKAIKKKADDAKRVIIEQGQRLVWELELRCVAVTHTATHLWRQIWPRLVRSIDEVNISCGNALQTLRYAFASFVQVRQEADELSTPIDASFTDVAEVAIETYGPAGQLESSAAGHRLFPRLRLNSWKWTTPPIAWNDDLFGVDWSLNPFGDPEEEQAFT